MKGATRKDVAREAGVSKTTVTYVLRNVQGTSISEETRRRVRKVAKKLNYHPSFAASSLVRGKTEVIGLLLPSQEGQFGGFYSRIIGGLVAAALETPYHFLYLGQDQPDKYQRCLAEHYVDGVIVLQSINEETHVSNVLAHDVPAVCMNYISRNGVPSVAMDVCGALDTCYEFMLARKRRRIAFLMKDSNIQPNQRQIRHHELLRDRYREWAEFEYVDMVDDRHGLEVVEKLAADPSWDGYVIEGLASLHKLRIGLEAANRKIGEDLDIAAINIADNGSDYPSGVLLVDAQPSEIGRIAWDLLQPLLAGEEATASCVLVPFVAKNRETVVAQA